MMRVVLVFFGGLLLTLAACGADGNKPSLEPLGGEDLGTGMADDTLFPEDGSSHEGNPNCEIDCSNRECGSDGCGGTCGACGTGMNCLDGECAMGCDSAACDLGVGCVFADGTPALCGGNISFDTNLQGQKLADNVNVETMYATAGVYLYTPSDNAAVATNHWELDSTSGKNSCASFDKNGQAWREPVYIRFAKPAGESAFQAATHYVSLFVGDSWPGGIAVDFYAPGPSPGSPGVEPFHTEMTTGNGTSFIEFGSGSPIGYVVVHKADDPDFTIDDLSFGPLYIP
jgi:hypothetical protein